MVSIKGKSRKAPRKSVKRSTPRSDPELWKTTEKALTAHLDPDRIEAYQKLKSFLLSLGPQNTYASGKAVVFSKTVSYAFVRPKTKDLEVVLFLPQSEQILGFHRVQKVSSQKYSHTFKLTHADQVEGLLTKSLQTAYKFAK